MRDMNRIGQTVGVSRKTSRIATLALDRNTLWSKKNKRNDGSDDQGAYRSGGPRDGKCANSGEIFSFPSSNGPPPKAGTLPQGEPAVALVAASSSAESSEAGRGPRTEAGGECECKLDEETITDSSGVQSGGESKDEVEPSIGAEL